MGLLESETGSGESGVKVDGAGTKSGSLSVLKRAAPSPFSRRVDRSSLANKSFQSTSPTLVMAVESMMFGPVLGAVAKGDALFCGAVLVFALAAGALGAGAAVGTEMGSLHFGQGKVWPSSCSWRTTILLEQWGHASLNGSTGAPNLGNRKAEV